ncbi:MAG: hypothetical protein WCO55_06210 [Candidatus Falkowbacteria bacterium]
MKKVIIIVLLSLLLTVGQTVQAQVSKPLKPVTIYKSRNTTISAVWNDRQQFYFYSFLLNNKTLEGKNFNTNDFESPQTDWWMRGGQTSFKLYKTDVKNVFVTFVHNDPYEGGEDFYSWKFVDIGNKKILTDINVEFCAICQDNKPYILYFNSGKDSYDVIEDIVESKGCEQRSISSEADAKKIEPLFKGFTSNDGKQIYNTKTLSPLYCTYNNQKNSARFGTVYPQINYYFIGLGKDKTSVYFSLTGKDWTSYYSYSLATKKITKTTQNFVNKNKMNLTLLKTL